MATVYLEEGETFVAASAATIHGASGNEQVTILDGVTGVDVDSSVDQVNFSGSTDNYQFKQNGITLEVYDSEGNLIVVMDSPDMTPTFNGEEKDIDYSGGTMTFNGTELENGADPVNVGTPQVQDDKVTVTQSGSSDASTGDLTYEFTSSGVYDFTVNNFATGDKLDFVDSNVSIQNTDISDGIVTLTWNDGTAINNIVVNVTGISTTDDANLYSVGQFNVVFGDGTLIF